MLQMIFKYKKTNPFGEQLHFFITANKQTTATPDTFTKPYQITSCTNRHMEHEYVILLASQLVLDQGVNPGHTNVHFSSHLCQHQDNNQISH